MGSKRALPQVITKTYAKNIESVKAVGGYIHRNNFFLWIRPVTWQ